MNTTFGNLPDNCAASLEEEQPMTIYRKTLFVIVAVLITLIGLLYIASRSILMESYTALEAQDTRLNVERALNAIDTNVDNFKLIALGWSKWDDTRDFVLRSSEEWVQTFIDVNLLDGMYLGTGFNLSVFMNAEGEIVHEKMVDLEAGHEVAFPESFRPWLEPDSPLLNHPDWSSEIDGFVLLPEGLMAVTSLPILDSIGNGPDVYGTLIWGYWFTPAHLESIAQATRLDLEMLQYDDPELPPDFAAIKSDPALMTSTIVRPMEDQKVDGYAVLRDITGLPVMLLRAEMLRQIVAQGQATLNVLLGTLLAIGVSLALLSLGILDRFVLRRLAQLSEVVTHVRDTGDLRVSLNNNGNDELSNLGQGLQSMWAELGKSRASLEEANNFLERRVEARTTELRTANSLLQDEITEREQAQRELAIARDQALESLRVKNQILANVSHDARTPLTLINLRCEMAQLGMFGEVNAKALTAFGEIMDSSKQVVNFMNNLLTEAQLSRDSIKLASEPLAPADLIGGLVQSMEPLAKRKGLELRLECQPGLPPSVMGDSVRLKQVFTNLIDNAIKFTAKGQVVVQVGPAEGNRWVVQVQDTGPGIPAEAHSHIFEAFWQIDGSHTREANRGVGLGLSIVRQLVERMGGQVEVESEAGSGAVFRVVLPVALQSSVATPSESTLHSLAL